eukprot:Amastigsp_a339874_464.p1 type:complete len:179 gc:universal Amastigsp_a339874_464:56-592(+)
MAAAQQTVSLVVVDGSHVVVSEHAARVSHMLRNLMDDVRGNGDALSPIPLAGITLEVCTHVVRYMETHLHESASELSDFESAGYVPSDADREFVRDIGMSLRFDLIVAAHYMDIPGLMRLMTHVVAADLNGRSPLAITQMLGIDAPDFDAELDEILKYNEWAPPGDPRALPASMAPHS